MVVTSSKRKKLLIICSIVILLALSAVGLWFSYNKNWVVLLGKSGDSSLDALCSGKSAAEMQESIVRGEYDLLHKRAEEIQKLGSYDSNISCVYIVAESEVSYGDVDEAQRHYDRIQALLKDGQYLDDAFEQPYVQIDAVKDAIDHLRESDTIQTDDEHEISPDDLGETRDE